MFGFKMYSLALQLIAALYEKPSLCLCYFARAVAVKIGRGEMGKYSGYFKAFKGRNLFYLVNRAVTFCRKAKPSHAHVQLYVTFNFYPMLHSPF